MTTFFTRKRSGIGNVFCLNLGFLELGTTQIPKDIKLGIFHH